MDGVGKFSIFILPTIKACLEREIVPISSITSIASWYVFMQKINFKKIMFNYYEPNWDLIKDYLSVNKTKEFTKSKALWGDVPEKFPNFSKILNEQISSISKEYL